MQFAEFQKIEKLKKILDAIAYGSLALDFGIAIVTLISLRINLAELGKIQYFLNLALSGEVIVVSVLMVAMVFMHRYQKVIFDLARVSRSIQGKPGKGIRRTQRKLLIDQPLRASVGGY